MIRQQIKDNILNAVSALNCATPDGFLPDIETPKDKTHGDLSTNAAFALAKLLKKNPREAAEQIIGALDGEMFEKVEIAGAGFINFFLKQSVWHKLLKQILQENSNYGRAQKKPGAKKINLEFVSVNPTGPMHIAHGRWAVLGDTLANVLSFSGESVTREYYVNDYGGQVNILGESLRLRYLEVLGEKISFPEDGYRGEYLIELAKNLFEKYGASLRGEKTEKFKDIAVDYMLNTLIKNALSEAGVRFDLYFHESALHKEGALVETLNRLNQSGHTYKQDGAIFFKSTDFGDDKDRVLIKEDGESTYFLADIAYHLNKIQRGFDLLINIWGADHHGYVKRMRGGIAALGFDPSILHLIIGQLVTLKSSGELVKMSKRAGQMVTFKELIDEVGKDAVRFIFLTKSSNSHLEFDIELAKKKAQDNPVYYVQYAHARISSILRSAPEMRDMQLCDFGLLSKQEEIDIIKKLEEFPSLVKICAKNFEVHGLTHFAGELAGLFHSFYNKHKVLNPDNQKLTCARLYLILAIKIVLNIIADLLGINMPERM